MIINHRCISSVRIILNDYTMYRLMIRNKTNFQIVDKHSIDQISVINHYLFKLMFIFARSNHE